MTTDTIEAPETTEARRIEGDEAAIRLNLGAGPLPIEGWTNLDIKDGRDCCDLSDYPDESVDHIRASHVLEHLGREDSIRAAFQWSRKLKPGGTLSIAVPDLEWIVARYRHHDFDPAMLEAYLGGGQLDQHDYHKSHWDQRKLRNMFKAIGLGGVRPWYSHMQDCASLPVSLNLRATKLPCRLDGVRMVMTMPRHSFTRMGQCLTAALRHLNLELLQNQGVFWHHGLDRLFCAAIDSGAEWVLTADYDTIFEPGDILHLLDIADQFHLDAVFPLQAARNATDKILARVVDADGKPRDDVSWSELQAPTIRAQTGHFGLTLLRVEALKKVPTPWFAAHPNESGHYGDGRVDEDIHFWHQWEKAGLAVHMANNCVVGHLQEVISWPTRNYQVDHQLTYDYDGNAKPGWAR